MFIKKKETGVLLGRFAPLHKGHENLIQLIINQHGLNHTLILIGSANIILNNRTPFTYEQRKQMIKLIFPKIKILPLPDTNPEQIIHPTDEISINKWLDNIEHIANNLQTDFIFYGGNEDDLKYLALRFKTKVLLDRASNKISATNIRKWWQEKNILALNIVLSPQILSFMQDNSKFL